MSRIPYEERVKTYDLAKCLYGRQNQMIVAIEEMAEVQKEITKALRHNPDNKHMAEEIADARICLEQVARIFDIEDCVDNWMEQKILKLNRKMERDFPDV